MEIDELVFSHAQQEGDSAVNRFYEKLSELFSTWIILED